MDPSTPPWRALEASSDEPSTAPPTATSGSLRGWVPVACFALAILLALAAFVVAATGAGGVVEVDGADIAAASDPGDTPVPSGAVLLVEVSGAVAKPGVYRVPAGARVVDAIEAAGGFGPRVDMARADAALNLAAPVHDGEELHVPTRDDPASAVASGAAPTGAAAGPIDLNGATEAQLDALPGVGPATVAKIVAARPFASVDELRSKGVVGEKTLEKLRPLVTVGS